ncbi:MAG: SUF system NifU family Fe-S cluster assembly protein [Treponemataceae bacterium]|nr:SUF system NifU family Fe-S cluster assembly protein [Treponemataceae bacterium]
MEINNFYNEILIDHNLHPVHKHDIEGATHELEGVNPSCGDDITLKLKVEDGVIIDGSYVGQGCAVSQASADMMLDLIIGKKIEEAEHLRQLFMKMIKGEISEEELEELDEAGALQDIAHMPARVKCAVLGWRTMGEMFNKDLKTDEEGMPTFCSH